MSETPPCWRRFTEMVSEVLFEPCELTLRAREILASPPPTACTCGDCFNAIVKGGEPPEEHGLPSFQNDPEPDV